MEQLKNTTELIGLKDKNIKIKTIFKADTHILIEAILDYQPPLCPHCKSQMSKFEESTMSALEKIIETQVKTIESLSNELALLREQVAYLTDKLQE